jgi:16S rRNA (adenine1518-N6/adenine1519-N6)-dimethyltransferase
MVQKEVARRMAAQAGDDDYGILSVFCGYYAETSLLFTISPNAFFPKPGVMSAIVRLAMRPHPLYPAKDDALFRAMVRSAFGKRRKTLKNSLSYFAEGRGFVLPDLSVMSRRPEELPIADLVELSNTLFEHAREHTTAPPHE